MAITINRKVTDPMADQLSKRRRNQVRKSAGNEIARYLENTEYEDAAEKVRQWVDDWAEE